MKLLNRHMYNLVTNEDFLMLLWKASKLVLIFFLTLLRVRPFRHPCSVEVEGRSLLHSVH